MNNSRLGATTSFPMGRQQSLKVAYKFRRSGAHRDEFPDVQHRVAVATLHAALERLAREESVQTCGRTASWSLRRYAALEQFCTA